MELSIQNLHKTYDKAPVLKGLSANLTEGRIYGILGRNGSGKTTLFRCLAENIPYETGKIILKTNAKEEALKGDSVGLVQSEVFLPEYLTGKEFLEIYKELNPGIFGSIEESFAMVQLSEEDGERLIKTYSLGMKNKLQLLAVLLGNPEVLLLDEPLSSIDIVSSVEMKRLLVDCKKNRITLLSTHIPALARDLCDEILILKDGVLHAVPEEVFHSEDFEAELYRLLGGEEA